MCRWAYEQIAEALCKLYKDPEGRVGQHLLFGSPRAGCPGLLADALLDLAQGLAGARMDIRLVNTGSAGLASSSAHNRLCLIWQPKQCACMPALIALQELGGGPGSLNCLAIVALKEYSSAVFI